MANVYKNAFFDLTTTNKVDIYTCPSTARAIIQTVQVTNHAGSNPELEVYVYDDSASTEYEISHNIISTKTYKNMIDGPLVLEESDVLRMQTATPDALKGFISILEVNRD